MRYTASLAHQTLRHGHLRRAARKTSISMNTCHAEQHDTSALKKSVQACAWSKGISARTHARMQVVPLNVERLACGGGGTGPKQGEGNTGKQGSHGHPDLRENHVFVCLLYIAILRC